jgi:hypothetical protein
VTTEGWLGRVDVDSGIVAVGDPSRLLDPWVLWETFVDALGDADLQLEQADAWHVAGAVAASVDDPIFAVLDETGSVRALRIDLTR